MRTGREREVKVRVRERGGEGREGRGGEGGEGEVYIETHTSSSLSSSTMSSSRLVVLRYGLGELGYL